MSKDGMNYLPAMRPAAVVKQGEFFFAATGFDHGHIYSQVQGLAHAGGQLKAVFEPRPEKLKSLHELFDKHKTKIVTTLEEILDDPEILLVTAAAIPDERSALGIRVMEAGKDYLTDKSPFTSLDQLEQVREVVQRTGRKYAVCYSERLCSEAGWQAGELIAGGCIGRVLQVLSLAPHNLAAASRPEWFFQKRRYGGILTDIGSHSFEQFLTYAQAQGGTVLTARVENFANSDTPELEDFGEALLALDTGASAYCRMDWFNPAASRVWGDGRTFVLGTSGYMEIRKYVDLCRPESSGDRILLVNQEKETEIECAGKVGFPYFGRLILDVLQRTEKAMTQAHAFLAAELSMRAQTIADRGRFTSGSHLFPKS